MSRSIARNVNQRKQAVGSQVSSWVNFDPRSIPSLITWHDASDKSTITETGNRVSQWNDKSGNNLHVVQGNATLQPVTNTSNINNLNTLDFVSGRRLVLQNVAQTANVSGITLFAVASGTFNTGGRTLLFGFTVNNDAQNARAAVYTITSTCQAGGRRLDTDAFQTVLSATISNNSPVLVVGIFDYENTNLRVRKNRTESLLAGNFQTAGSTSNTNSRLSFGTADSGIQPFSGSIGETLAFNRRLTNNEIKTISDYLFTKWAIQP